MHLECLDVDVVHAQDPWTEQQTENKFLMNLWMESRLKYLL